MCVKYWNSEESLLNLSDSAAFRGSDRRARATVSIFADVFPITRRNRYILPLTVLRPPTTGPRPRVQVLLSHVSAEHADKSILTTCVVAVQAP